MIRWRITIRARAALCCAFVIATGSLSYSQSADLAATIAELEDSVRRKPELAEGWYDLGQTYVRRARESDGRDTPSYFRDLERALASLRQASQLRPDLPNIHNLLGWLHQEVGDIAAAVKEFREAIQSGANIGERLSQSRFEPNAST